jgi:hypothetical protein
MPARLEINSAVGYKASFDADVFNTLFALLWQWRASDSESEDALSDESSSPLFSAQS